MLPRAAASKPRTPKAGRARFLRLPRGGIMLVTALVAFGVLASRMIETARQWPAVAQELSAPVAWLVSAASAEQRPGEAGATAIRKAGPVIAHSPAGAVAPSGHAGPIDPASYGVLEDVATDLRNRQGRIEEREAALAAREAAAGQVEARADAQLKRLEAYKSELTALADRITQQERQQMQRLVKVYESMKPASAAEVFDGLDLDVLMPIVKAMNGQRLGKIVAQMDPGKAQEITVEMARMEPLPILKP